MKNKKRMLILSLLCTTTLICSCHHYRHPTEKNELYRLKRMGNYCQDIKRRLHAGHHRDYRNFKQTAITDAKLMRDYEKYDCEK